MLESYDKLIDDPQILMDIVNADVVQVRMSGERYLDHTLTNREIDIIKRALATYEQYGGKLP